MKAVDMFAGWGGFTLGARQAGLDVVWAGNHWPLAVSTHTLNHPDVVHECQDLRQADWTKLPDFDILLASPACQGHSSASQPRRNRTHDALRATALAVIECADICKPRAVVVENVPGFLRWRLYPWWCLGLETLGYQVEVRTLTASFHGAPQRRTRMFVLATLPGVEVPDLRPDNEEMAFGPFLQDVPLTHWKDLATAPDGVRRRVSKARQRCGDVFLTQHTSGHSGVPLQEPIRTITTAAGHWNLVEGGRYRPLTTRELARGMGFPDTFHWPAGASISDVTKGLGNAVCPPVAKRLLEAVADAVA